MEHRPVKITGAFGARIIGRGDRIGRTFGFFGCSSVILPRPCAAVPVVGTHAVNRYLQSEEKTSCKTPSLTEPSVRWQVVGAGHLEIELAHCSGATAMGDLVAKARLGREMVQIISFKIFLDRVKELNGEDGCSWSVDTGYWILDSCCTLLSIVWAGRESDHSVIYAHRATASAIAAEGGRPNSRR
jgi:hypothetical protein